MWTQAVNYRNRGGAVIARASRLVFIILLLHPVQVRAGTLTYTLSGLEGEVRQNVLAWLGTEPDTVEDRLNFVVSARERVQSSLRAIGYYRPSIDITLQRTDPVWKLAIAVDQGTAVHFRNIEINLVGPAKDDQEFTRLVDNTAPASGDVLHHGQFENFRNSLLTLAQQRGYFDAEVTGSRVEVEASAGTADLLIQFDSGPRYRFGEMLSDSTLATPSLLTSLASFAPGDLYEQSKLQALQGQLQLTGFFSTIVVQPLHEKAEDGRVPIAVDLRAAPRHSFAAGIGYSTDTEERLSLTWRTPRINRYGHSQETRLEFSRVNPSGRFTYQIPLSHPFNDVMQFWARIEDNEFGDLDSEQEELGVSREIRRGKWIYGYSLRGLDESWDQVDENFRQDNLLLGASVSSRTHSGTPVDPTSGFNQLYTLEVGNRELGSDLNIARFTANLRYIITPAPRHRLVSRAEFGVAEVGSDEREDLAPSLSFFAGGSHSIRGFSYQSLGNEIDITQTDGSTKTLVTGGDRLFTASVEYQYYFNEKWRGALFADGGDAFDEGEFDWNYGAGFGLHFLSPVGAVRVALANSLSDDNPDWYLHLNIGAEF